MYPLAGLAVTVTCTRASYTPPEGDTAPAPEGLTLTLSVYVGVGVGGGLVMTIATMIAIVQAMMIPANFPLLIPLTFVLSPVDAHIQGKTKHPRLLLFPNWDKIA